MDVPYLPGGGGGGGTSYYPFLRAHVGGIQRVVSMYEVLRMAQER
jgi:hypothetical protein